MCIFTLTPIFPLSRSPPTGEFEYVVFGEMVQGQKFFTMSNTTNIFSPLPILLLCGNLRVRPKARKNPSDTSEKRMSILSVDGWISFQADAAVAAQIVMLRKRLHVAFLKLVENPIKAEKNFDDKAIHSIQTACFCIHSAFKVCAKERREGSA